MKRILLLALCAFVAGSVGARTLYVDASRPNNNGNGRSAKTAKKTIQAAINIAKSGDTIVVAPGTYSTISTKNKNLKIKGKKGSSKTTIRSTSYGGCVAKLGKEWSHKYTRTYQSSGGGGERTYTYTVKSGSQTKGTKTKVSGFTVDGSSGSPEICVSGGTLTSCVIAGHHMDYQTQASTVYGAKLTGCTIRDCGYGFDYSDNGYSIDNSTLNRCKILNNDYSDYEPSSPCQSSKFYNCLFAVNRKVSLKSCMLMNCTVADNTGTPAQSNKVGPGFRMSKTKAYNTIFNGVDASQFTKAKKNTLKNCYKGSNPKFVSTKTKTTTWVADRDGQTSRIIGAEVYWDRLDNEGNWLEDGYVTVSGTTDSAILVAAKKEVGKPNATYTIADYDYEYGDYKTVLDPGDYHLKKGSPCINKGKLTAAQKKAVGKKDLAGKKRIKGKSVDIGCYEF